MKTHRPVIATIAGLVFLLSSVMITGCYHVDIDTYEKWCARHSGEFRLSRDAPFWAVLPSISFHHDAVRDDFARILNEALFAPMKNLTKLNNRIERMAWRENTALHLVVDPWRAVVAPTPMQKNIEQGIEKTKAGSHEDKAANCHFAAMTYLFDSVRIHYSEFEGEDIVLVPESYGVSIPTGRKELFKKAGTTPP